MKRIWVVLILVLAFCGLAVSNYLAEDSLSGASLADYGVLFYSIIFALAALELLADHRFARRAIQIFSLAGLITSLWLSLNQDIFAGTLASALIALLIFIFSCLIEPLRELRQMLSLPPPSSPPTISLPGQSSVGVLPRRDRPPSTLMMPPA